MRAVDWMRVVWRTAKILYLKPMVNFVLAPYRSLMKTYGEQKRKMLADRNWEHALALIRNSPLFDADWYLRNNPDVAKAGIDPAVHYLKFGVVSNRNPSISFVNEEYYALHHDVRASKMNPLVHYEKYGRREGRAISVLEDRLPVFPEGCAEGIWRFDRVRRVHGRTAVVASYFGKGEIPETLVYLLKGLREVVDNIVYVADCPVLPGEVEKLRGIVTVAKFERHCQYDFGSYKRGLAIARSEGLLDPDVAEELVVMNDSNYGPVYPFAESFGKMAERSCDFWGMTPYKAMLGLHLQSFFYVFRRGVVDSGAIDAFLSRVQGQLERDKVIVLFELRFTMYLADLGFTWDSVVPQDILRRGSPMKFPLTLCGRYRMPLLKVKAVNGDSYEDVGKVLKMVRKVNPELAALIVPKPIKAEPKMTSYEEHQAAFPAKCARLAAKLREGKRLRAVFFVTNASMFPAKPMFDAMLRDYSFEPRIVVIPDLRWRGVSPVPAMEKCHSELQASVPEGCLSMAERDEFGLWQDVLADADIVCYPSPYELSSFRYNPRYAVGRDFLPVSVNYGYYRSLYDRHVMGGQSYAYMWKAFFECDDTMAEYAEYSVLKGANADLSGYVKMDALACASSARPANRAKRILIAPHHSVAGGSNDTLALSNFERYAELFLELPKRYPQVEFVFRPHPFLFQEMARPRHWGVARTKKYVEDMKANANVVWSEGGDYLREFAEADACVQDCGSYLVEWLYTKKPCCYMLKSPRDADAKFAPLGKKCLGQCYVAYDEKAIADFIDNVVVAGDDPKREGREAFFPVIAVNYPHAAETALAHVKAAIQQADLRTEKP